MDDFQRKLRRTAEELEQGSRGLPPARKGPKLRYGVAGLGMAACIAAALVLFTQLLPKDQPAGRIGSAASPASTDTSTAQPIETLESSPMPSEPDPTAMPPDPPDSYPAPPDATPSTAETYCPDYADRPETRPEGVLISASSAREDDGLRLTAKFKNERSTPVRNNEGNPRVAWIVRDEQSRIVWNSTYGKVYTQELRTVDYAPGEEVSVSEVWDLRTCGPDGGAGPKIGAGTYTVFAFWSGENGGPADPTTFTQP